MQNRIDDLEEIRDVLCPHECAMSTVDNVVISIRENIFEQSSISRISYSVICANNEMDFLSDLREVILRWGQSIVVLNV